MPLTDENIFYADESTPLAFEAISAAQATSVGNNVKDLLDQTGLSVGSDRERDDLFPEPKQGDTVWRTDLYVEQRYYEGFSTQVNPGGREPAGWYATKNTFVPILSADLSGQSEFIFNNIFNKTFTTYVLLISGLTSAGSSVSLRLVSPSGVESGSVYDRSSIEADGTVIAGSRALGTVALVSDAASTHFISDTTITNPSFPVRTHFLTRDGDFVLNSSARVRSRYANVLTNSEYTGIRIGLSTGGATFTRGKIVIYGVH